jgi:hypothetical protein
MRRPTMGALGSMALALLPAYCLPSRRGKGNAPVARSCARRQHTPSRPTVFVLRRTHEWQAFGTASHSPHPRSLGLDLCQVLGKARRIVCPYRHTGPEPRPEWFSPTSASCRHLPATLRDNRRFRPSACIRADGSTSPRAGRSPLAHRSAFFPNPPPAE